MGTSSRHEDSLATHSHAVRAEHASSAPMRRQANRHWLFSHVHSLSVVHEASSTWRYSHSA